MNESDLIDLLVRLTESIHFVGIILCLKYYSRLSFPTKVIVWHLILLFICNVSASILAKMWINNYFVLHILTILDLAIMGYFYSLVIEMSPKRRLILFGVIAAALVFCLMDSLFISSIKKANAFSLALAGSLKILLIVSYFLSSLSQKTGFTSKDYVFWNIFSSCLLLYTSSTLLFFMFMSHLMKMGIDLFPLLVLNTSLFFFTEIIIFYGITRYIFGVSSVGNRGVEIWKENSR